jgi:hypothetical protein
MDGLRNEGGYDIDPRALVEIRRLFRSGTADQTEVAFKLGYFINFFALKFNFFKSYFIFLEYFIEFYE